MAIQIRKAKPEDIEQLLAFEQGIILAERPFDPTLRAGHFHYYDILEMIKSEEAEVLVAEINNELVGSGYAKIKEGKTYNAFQNYAYLGFMYTVPQYRGKGVNQAIIAALIEWARSKNLTEIRLEVYAGNTPAVKAYEKAGFTKNLVEMRTVIG